ncbi:MAG: hypothetical protein C4330_09615 [Chitinophagaceae bacterium]
MKLSHFFTASILSLSLLSCKEEATDNANGGDAAIAYKMQATNYSSAINRTEAGNLEWTSGTANANLLKFEAKSSGSEVDFKSSIQQSIVLFNPTTLVGHISLPAGTYSEVEFKAQLNPANGNPALQLTGTYTNGNFSANVRFVVNKTVLVKAEKIMWPSHPALAIMLLLL